MQRRQVAQEPAPDLRSLQSEVSEPVARFVGGLLAKDPAARPWPASRVAAYLGQLAEPMADKPSAAAAGGPMSRR